MKWIKRFIYGWKSVNVSTSFNRTMNIRHLNKMTQLLLEIFFK